MKPFAFLSVCLCLAALPALLAAAASGDAAKGKSVFEQRCVACHNADSTDKKMGPGLKGLFQRDKLKTGKKVNEANVRARIEEGGGGMPPFKDILTDPEKTDLIAYLKTL